MQCVPMCISWPYGTKVPPKEGYPKIDKHFPVETKGYTLIDSRIRVLEQAFPAFVNYRSYVEIFKILSWTDREPQVYSVWWAWTMLRPMLRPLNPDSFHCRIYCTASRPHNNKDSEFGKMSFGAEIWPLKSLVSHPHWHICAEHSGLLICK
ncbi:hypothetical protein VNO77_37910 [Canavalia gladiata]|uniref:Uncharacterized protein n=1 Tax=Canavalia gladiata TaxID=3824 RepID=A0AAN9KAG3_CANGL